MMIDTNVVSEVMRGDPTGVIGNWLGLPRDEVRDVLAIQVLALDSGTALVAGELMADAERHGRSLAVPDAQVAATCLVHRTALATRNVRDFAGLGIDIVNPWD